MTAGPAVQRLLQTGREFFWRHWQRVLVWRERLHLSEEAFHLILACVVGVISGLTNLAYHRANELIQLLVLSRPGELAAMAEALAPWQLVLVPTLGGLAAGLVLFLGLRLIGNPGLSNLLEVVVAGDGRLRLRPALINAASSLLSMSTGASIGREGLLTQLSASFASKLGQLRHWPPYRLRLMVACGAAAGMASAYNAPIGGAVFAAQIVLGNFSMNLFAPLVVSSVTAAVLSRSFFGISRFDAPMFEFTRLTQLPWFLLLGVFCGLVGALFLRALTYAEGLFAKMPLPLYARLGIAGLFVGLIALEYPQVCGNGYGAIDPLLRQEPAILFVMGLFAAKFLATAISVGAGTVGGVFTPTLFLGAAAGGLFEAILHQQGWALPLPTGCFALVGMGGTLAATTHSPLLAMIMLFELSLNYSLMPPLMLACAVATLVGRRLRPQSIYTEPLLRKGLELDRESPRLGAAMEQTVGDLMQPPVSPMRDNTPFRAIAEQFLTQPNNFLPVIDADDRLVGMVALHDLKQHLNAAQELSSIIASDVMRPPPACLTPQQRLLDALPVLLSSEQRNVPVVNNVGQFKLVGAVERAEALGVLSEAISFRTTMKKQPSSRPGSLPSG